MSDIRFLPSPAAVATAENEALGADPARPAAVAGWRRLVPRSLTARLIVGVVTLVAVLVVVVGTVTYFALHSYLLGRLDQQVRATAAQNSVFFNQCVETVTVNRNGQIQCRNDGPPQTQQEWIAAILPPSGRELTFRGDFVNPLFLSNTQRRQLAANPDQIMTVADEDANLRVAGRFTQEGRLIATGLSTSEIDLTMSRLVAQELIIGGLAVLIAVLATYYGVRFSLRRLRRVTDTAHEVAAELSPDGAGLDRRVPVTEEGTEVGQLAESMNTLLAAVETQFAARVESEERMRRFLADASHELRTPLTSIRGYAELARMQRVAAASTGTVDPVNSDIVNSDNLDRIEAEGTRMSRLVEDLLLLARGDRGSPPARELIDVPDLVADAVISARAAYPQREIVIDATPPHHIIGDSDQLLRVLRNLINNAAAHTRPDAPIRVRGVADGADILLQVADGGPGLAPEEAAHVFERFWRADKARTRASGGSGLGLSIVASIVRAHAGTVRFDSTVQGGSTVTVRLPAVHTGPDV